MSQGVPRNPERITSGVLSPLQDDEACVGGIVAPILPTGKVDPSRVTPPKFSRIGCFGVARQLGKPQRREKSTNRP